MSPVNDGASVRIEVVSTVAECEACSSGAEFSLRSDDEDGARDGAAKSTPPNQTAFDTRYYLDLIRARGATIRRVARALKPALGLTTAIDAGCGVGFFAQTL